MIAQAVPPQAQKEQSFQMILRVVKGDVVNYYRLVPLPYDGRAVQWAVRYEKLGDGEKASYDVRETAEGWWECECLGFLGHGHCKHIKTAQAARKVFG